MYIYDKSEGLHKTNLIPENSVQIDVVSDLHLDFYKETSLTESEFLENYVNSLRENVESKNYEVLIVGGDISHKNSWSEAILRKLSEVWKYVLVIPGNHEWYIQKKHEDRYADLVSSLEDKENVIFLMDKVEIFEYKGIKIAGTFMAYNLQELKDYILWKQILNDSKFMSREFIQDRNEKDVEYYNNVIDDVDIFVSHVPIVNLDGLATTENLFLNVDVNPREGVLYLSGHTHRPKNSIDKYSGGFEAINVSYGYPQETGGRNPVVTIFVK